MLPTKPSEPKRATSASSRNAGVPRPWLGSPAAQEAMINAWPKGLKLPHSPYRRRKLHCIHEQLARGRSPGN